MQQFFLLSFISLLYTSRLVCYIMERIIKNEVAKNHSNLCYMIYTVTDVDRYR